MQTRHVNSSVFSTATKWKGGKKIMDTIDKTFNPPETFKGEANDEYAKITLLPKQNVIPFPGDQANPELIEACLQKIQKLYSRWKSEAFSDSEALKEM